LPRGYVAPGIHLHQRPPPVAYMQAAYWEVQRARLLFGSTAAACHRLSTAPAALHVNAWIASCWRTRILSRVMAGYVSKVQVWFNRCVCKRALLVSLTGAAANSGCLHGSMRQRSQLHIAFAFLSLLPYFPGCCCLAGRCKTCRDDRRRRAHRRSHHRKSRMRPRKRFFRHVRRPTRTHFQVFCSPIATHTIVAVPRSIIRPLTSGTLTPRGFSSSVRQTSPQGTGAVHWQSPCSCSARFSRLCLTHCVAV
jgi:hypothetical protein